MKGCLPLFMILGILSACSDSDSQLPTTQISPRNLEVTVRGRGELIASESIPIRLPDNVNMWFVISWMAPEFSEVRKGDVVARFDDTEISNQRMFNLLNMTDTEFKLNSHERAAAIARANIVHETSRISGEVDIAENFVEVDPRLFSRNEIIDKLGDLEYLGVEGAYYDWQLDTHTQRSGAERRHIAAGKKSSELNLQKQETALSMMELRSPLDGTFVYARTPWGQKLTKGLQIFAGRPVGFLPIRGKVKARIFVPEPDAVGLERDQSVSVRLDTAVDLAFVATVTSVSEVSTPRRPDDPQKYFVVEAEIHDVDPELMRVGGSLTATITTGVIENALLLPRQAVFFDKEDAYVFLMESNEPVMRQVSLGRRSPNLIEVVGGIQAGDRISMVAPTVAEG